MLSVSPCIAFAHYLYRRFGKLQRSRKKLHFRTGSEMRILRVLGEASYGNHKGFEIETRLVNIRNVLWR